MQIRVGVGLSVCVYVFEYLTVSYTSANCQITKLGKQIRSTPHIHKHLHTHTHRHGCLRMLFSMNCCCLRPGFRFGFQPSVAYKRGGQNKSTQTHTCMCISSVCIYVCVTLSVCVRLQLNSMRAQSRDTSAHKY